MKKKFSEGNSKAINEDGVIITCRSILNMIKVKILLRQGNVYLLDKKKIKYSDYIYSNMK